MSRDELARRLESPQNLLQIWNYGEKGASVKNLYRLKQIIGVSVDYLMDGKSVQSKRDGAAKDAQ